MCIGIPMQVLSVETGFANVQGRGETRRIKTTLIGDCAVGDWLLAFIDDAREIISAERAQEVNATLDLLQAVMGGDFSAGNAGNTGAGFALPSAMSAADLQRLTGQA
jgi:hydrogenase expression/formation protein HypC